MHESKAMSQIPTLKRVCLEDIERGADKLHDLLDGRIDIPEKLAVALVGIGSAVLPTLILWLIWRGA